jgi:hypothetical protein
MKPMVIDTIAEPPKPKLAPVLNLDTPDDVPCHRCGELTPAIEARCKSCGLLFSPEDQQTRCSIAYRQERGAQERSAAEKVAVERASRAAAVKSTTEALQREIEQKLAPLAAQAQQALDNAQPRLELAQAAAFANPTSDNDTELQRAQLSHMAAPAALKLAQAAVEQAKALMPLAEQADEKYNSAGHQEIKGKLDAKLAEARSRFDAGMKCIREAFELNDAHVKDSREAIALARKVAERLKAIRATCDLMKQFPTGHWMATNHEVVRDASAKAIADALRSSGILKDHVEQIALELRRYALR